MTSMGTQVDRFRNAWLAAVVQVQTLPVDMALSPVVEVSDWLTSLESCYQGSHRTNNVARKSDHFSAIARESICIFGKS